MAEWIVNIPGKLAKELEDCITLGPIVDDRGTRYFTEEVFARLGGLTIEVFSNEHPPPHFRVSFQGESNNFSIKDCAPLNGNALLTYFRNIKKWHKQNKSMLIESWNSKRPTDCPVGKYVE